MTGLCVAGIIVGFLLTFAGWFGNKVVASAERSLRKGGNADVPVPHRWLPVAAYAVGMPLMLLSIVALSMSF